MPNCKNCGARITKFNKDRCPVCGTINPLEGVDTQTIGMTAQLDLNDDNLNFPKPKKRLAVLLLSIFVGFTGAQFFYLKHTKTALIWLFANIAILTPFILLLGFLSGLGWIWSVLIPLMIIYVINICLGIVLYSFPNLKDGNGEFVH